MRDPRLEVRDTLGQRVVSIEKMPFSIGRRDTNDLRLGGSEVSRDHAEIVMDGDRLLLVPGNTQLLAPAKSNSTTLVVSFGMFDLTGTAMPTAAPVEFRAYAVTANAENQPVANLIWAKKLDPAANPEDRAMQFRAIRFDGPTPPAILLQTVSDSSSMQCMAYWSGVSFR